jgi:hypothetical protein
VIGSTRGDGIALLSRASRLIRLNEKPSSGLDPPEHHQETSSHPCITGCDKENYGGGWYLSAAAQSPLSMADPPVTKENEKVDGEMQNPLETSRRGCSNNSYESA